jgi:hypothetical protein
VTGSIGMGEMVEVVGKVRRRNRCGRKKGERKGVRRNGWGTN